MKSGIYCILNTANGKRYVGQSKDVKVRLRDHFSSLRGNYHKNRHLQSAFNQYGENSFEASILATCDVLLCDAFECRWIEHYKVTDRRYGYNLNSGGNNNKVCAEETKQKMSEKAKARLAKHGRSQETIEKYRKSMVKVYADPAYKKKMSEVGKKAWADGKYKPDRSVKISNTMKKVTSDPKWRENISSASKRSWADPAKRKQRMDSMKATMDKPEYREKLSKGIKAAWARRKEQAEKIA